jgi:hypothetical protein
MLTVDVILSIKPEFAELIAQRAKNYEYRKYKLAGVERIWLYETAPTSKLTYINLTRCSHHVLTYPSKPRYDDYSSKSPGRGAGSLRRRQRRLRRREEGLQIRLPRSTSTQTERTDFDRGYEAIRPIGTPGIRLCTYTTCGRFPAGRDD